MKAKLEVGDDPIDDLMIFYENNDSHLPSTLRTEEAGSFIFPVAYDYCPQLSIRTRTYHPMIQGKIERYFQSMKNVILLDIYYSPEELKARIGEWVDYYS